MIFELLEKARKQMEMNCPRGEFIDNGYKGEDIYQFTHKGYLEDNSIKETVVLLNLKTKEIIISED